MKTTRSHQSFARRLDLPTFLRRSLSVLGIGLLLLLLVRPGSAQAQGEEGRAHWEQHFVSQINTLLRSPDPALREQGMELIVKFQDEKEPRFDFSETRSQLYSIFFNSKNSDAHRILALSALYATDSEKMTSKTLAGWMDEEPSMRVRRHVALALHQRG